MPRFVFFYVMMIFSITNFSVLAETPAIGDQDSAAKSISQISNETEIETGLLKAKPGYVGDVLGAKIESISIDEAHDMQIIEINVPIEPEDVDRVKVISKSGKTIKQDKSAEILKDYENNNVGIKLYLPKKKNWQFKLHFVDESDTSLQ